MTENTCCCDANEDCCNDAGVRIASTKLTMQDVLGAWGVRWGFRRSDYTVEPGLYAVGEPSSDSPVLVSANYKLTFDILRKNLDRLDCWLLILDTDGVNVWCAAGKGTFGTEELVHRIEESELSKYVSHNKLILPQLGATGVSAFEVKKQSGYAVDYGPVRACDIKEYISSGYEATKEMRLVQFNMWDRLVLTPMELIPAIKTSLPILGVLFITNQFARAPLDKHDLIAYLGAVLAGSVTTPALLPYIPGKAFAWKGWYVGFGWTVKYLIWKKRFKGDNRLKSIGELLLLPAVSSFLAMNFTGASTYTSPSGVNKEMKKALPLIIGTAAIGSALILGAHLFGRRKVK